MLIMSYPFVVHTHTHTAILECYRAQIPCFPSAAMLTIHKNRVVSDVTLQQAAVRQKEPGSVGWRFLLYTTVIIVDLTYCPLTLWWDFPSPSHWKIRKLLQLICWRCRQSPRFTQHHSPHCCNGNGRIALFFSEHWKVVQPILAPSLVRLDIDCCLSLQELDFYTNNFWIFGGTTVILAGFSLAQLTREIPDGTHPALECLDRRLCCEREDSNRDVHEMCIDVYIIQWV